MDAAALVLAATAGIVHPMNPIRVYVALQQFGKHDERPRRLLEETGYDVRYNTLGRRLQRDELAVHLRETDAVLAGVEPYDATLLGSLPRLRCISRCGVGTDAIDLDAAKQHRIAVYTTVEEVVEPTAQLTIAMILALARNIPQHLADFHGGAWTKHTGALLSEWTVGLIGFGRIGCAVASLLAVFSPRIVVTDPAVSAEALPRHVAWRPLSQLLAEADVVSLHANSPRRLGPLLGREQLACMKRGSRLVNTARGHLVDEAALYEALVSGHLAGAALDVFEQEPYTGPLAHLPQVLCTPHVATLTKASRTAMERRCVENVVGFFAPNTPVVGVGRV
jgi:D-3-phosphoglycerate dehydrogenase